MVQKRLYSMQEELERLSRENTKVQLFINKNYSLIGTIETVEFDFIRAKEYQEEFCNKMINPYVNIPIDKIQYVRIIK